MDFLCLLGGSDLPSTNSPNWFVRNDDLRPVRDLVLDSLQLRSDDLDRLVVLSLLQGFTAAEDNAESSIEGGLDF